MKHLKRFNESIDEDIKLYNDIVKCLEEDPFLLSGKIQLMSKLNDGRFNGYTFRYDEVPYKIYEYEDCLRTINPNNKVCPPKHHIFRKNSENLVRLLLDSNKKMIVLANLVSSIMTECLYLIKKDEIASRLEEFEVIKGDTIDLINLSHVYNYYDIQFDKSDIKFISNYLDENNINNLT